MSESIEYLLGTLRAAIKASKKSTITIELFELKIAIEAANSQLSDQQFSEILAAVGFGFKEGKYEFFLVVFVEEIYRMLSDQQKNMAIEFLCLSYGNIKQEHAILEIAEVVGSMRNPYGLGLIQQWLDNWMTLSPHALKFVENAVLMLFDTEEPLSDEIRARAVSLGKRYHALVKPNPLQHFPWQY